MVKLTFEVWEHGDGVAMFQRGSKGRKDPPTPPVRLLHTYQAETLHTAYQTYYDLMGWGEWNTKGIDDRIFTEEDIGQPDVENSK
ncbi:MAG: hypothetical protein ABSD74_20270 [Rhizomicrobium sp.]|jgi:hypothetical protein